MTYETSFRSELKGVSFAHWTAYMKRVFGFEKLQTGECDHCTQDKAGFVSITVRYILKRGYIVLMQWFSGLHNDWL
jgi:hypothetical protein